MHDKTYGKPILIMAGGTGGHIYPALAVATRLRELGVPLLWLGSRHGMETRIVPQAGITLLTIAIAGLRGRGALALLAAPFKLLGAVAHALVLLSRARPAAVLGMGGFASGPGGLAAWLLRVPLLLHEQNAILGFTNRMLAPLAARLMEAFPGAFADARAMHTGNPVRSAIASVAAPAERVLHGNARRLLVLGGSQGARTLNQRVPAALALLATGNENDGAPPASSAAKHRIEVWHQAGRDKLEFTRVAYANAGVTARVDAYIENMHEAYAWADLVLCRAGAMTIAELSAAGAASVLVPYPHSVDDHQSANARYLVDAGAAVLLSERELTAPRLAALIDDLFGEPQRLIEFAEAARRVGRPQATEQVAQACLEVAYA